MTREELKRFIQARFLELNPYADVEEGSVIYTQLIGPVISLLGDKGLEMDVRQMVRTRLKQEHDISVVDGDAIDDLAIKPLAIALEPFKLELENIKNNQSLKNIDSMSMEAAQALAANLFLTPLEGSFASGVVRLFFKAPTFAQVSPSTRFYTDGGLSYFAQDESSLSASQMAGNRYGDLYYFDVLVRAENPGLAYNVGANVINQVEGVGNIYRIGNPAPIAGGADGDTITTLYNRLQRSFTERSLTNERGIYSRLTQFDGVRDVLVIGHGDPEMQRDLVTGMDEGRLFASGTAILFNHFAVLFNGFEDRGADGQNRPSLGDKVILNYYSPWFIGLSPDERNEQFTLTRILFSSLDAGFTGFPGIFVVELDRLPSQTSTTRFPWLPGILLTKFALKQQGVITISDMPGGIFLPNDEGNFEIPDNQVHVGGAFDIYIRPTSLDSRSVMLPSIGDDKPLMSGIGLKTFGGTSTPNAVSAFIGASSVNWFSHGVEPGFSLIIEAGIDAGVYKILQVYEDVLIIDSDLKASEHEGLKFKVLDALDIDLVSPKKLKVPFGGYVANDLKTQVSSPIVKVSSDLRVFGVDVGDTLEILETKIAGTYTIQEFQDDGKAIVLDRLLLGSFSNLAFQVYSSYEGVQLPLSRITKVELLDDENQATGVIIPPADPIMTVNRCCFTGSANRCSGDIGVVLPDLSAFEPNTDFTESEGCSEAHELVHDMVEGMEFSDDVYKLKDGAPEHQKEAWERLTGEPWTSESYIKKSEYWLWVALGKIWLGGYDSESEETLGGPWGFYFGGTVWGGSGSEEEMPLLDYWLELVEVTKTLSPGEALGPFRVRRCYSDGCSPCDGHIVCVCLDYNTQFELCLPFHLFDECNNSFLALPDIDLANLLDSLERLTYNYSNVQDSEDNDISLAQVLKEVIPEPCLCEAYPGDVLTLQAGANAGAYIIESLHEIVIDLALWSDDDSLHAVSARFGGTPFKMCLAKIEGEFPVRPIQFLTDLIADKRSIEGLLGDKYGEVEEYVESVFSSESLVTFDEIAGFDAQDWLDKYKIPLRMGCGTDIGLSKIDSWVTYKEWLEKEYKLDPAVLASVIVILRRLNAFGFSSFGDLLKKDDWLTPGSPLDDEAFWLGGGLRFNNVTDFLQRLIEWIQSPDGHVETFSQFFLRASLILWGSIFLLPFSTAYDIATEYNADLAPDKLMLDFNKIWDFIKELLFTPYSVGSSIADNAVRLYFTEPTTIEVNAPLTKCYKGANPRIPTIFATSLGDTELLYAASSKVESYEIYPPRDLDNLRVPKQILPRDIEVKGLSSLDRNRLIFTDPLMQAPVQHLIRTGIDEIEIHEQRFVLPAPQPNNGGSAPFYIYTDLSSDDTKRDTAKHFAHKDMIPGLITTAKSNIVRIPDAAIYGFTKNMVGDLLFIEDGPDKGGYIIVKVLDGKKAVLDRLLTYSTIPIEKEGFNGSAAFAKGSGTFQDAANVFTNTDVGKYLTVYGCPESSYNGSYRIDTYSNPGEVVLDISSGSFPPAPDDVIFNGILQWCITIAPVTAPGPSSVGGLETVATVPYRQYYGEPTLFSIDQVSPLLENDLLNAFIKVSHDTDRGGEVRLPSDGAFQPFRIVRPGCQKITSAQMAQNTEDGLYFFDVLITSLGADEIFNIPENSRFWPIRGTYKSDGYRLNVEDSRFSYSIYEKVSLEVEPSVLPVTALDIPSNRYLLLGKTLQVSYEYSSVVAGVQAFVLNRLDRPVCASPLARQFLPAYPIINLDYVGGENTLSVGSKIQAYIENLSAVDVLQLDELLRIVKQSGATHVKMPLIARAVMYDLERKVVGIESMESLASDASPNEYLGSDRISYFITPENVSTNIEVPMGSRIFLRQLAREDLLT